MQLGITFFISLSPPSVSFCFFLFPTFFYFYLFSSFFLPFPFFLQQLQHFYDYNGDSLLETGGREGDAVDG